VRAEQGKAAETERGATPAQLREAERGFKIMLRRRFSAVWITENAADLMGQANVEYAEWLEVNPPARNPVGWLLTCAYRRAQNRLDSQTRRPTSTSLDAVLHVADETTPTPEQQALDGDRQARLQKALGHLPDKERKLLALVYFADLSIREAGRKLGWQKSAADRHHRAALDKLHALVGDRSLLSPAPLGVATGAVVYGDRQRLRDTIDAALTPGREALAIGAECVSWVGRQLAELGRRFAPVSDQAGAAASSGGGRVAGACGVAVVTVICGFAASGVVPSGGGAGIAPAVPAPGPDRPAADPTASPALAPTATLEVPAAIEREPAAAPAPTTTRSAATTKPARSANPPKATSQQTRTEFEVSPPSSVSSEPAPEVSEAPSTSTGSGSSSGGSPSGASTPPAREFGL
jgi:RNA polymerase sigma factor (sigma-70 family)